MLSAQEGLWMLSESLVAEVGGGKDDEAGGTMGELLFKLRR